MYHLAEKHKLSNWKYVGEKNPRPFQGSNETRFWVHSEEGSQRFRSIRIACWACLRKKQLTGRNQILAIIRCIYMHVHLLNLFGSANACGDVRPNLIHFKPSWSFLNVHLPVITFLSTHARIRRDLCGLGTARHPTMHCTSANKDRKNFRSIWVHPCWTWQCLWS